MGWALLAFSVVVVLAWGVSFTVGPSDEEMAARELLAFEEPATGTNGADLFREIRAGTDGDGEDIVAEGHAELFCSASHGECLARVRSEPDRYRDLVDRYGGVIEQLERLSGADHVTSSFTHDDLVSLSEVRLAKLPATALAVRFVDGDVDSSLGEVCEYASALLRLSDRADLLSTGLVLGDVATGLYGRLMAEMLVELPPGYLLPESCHGLGAPVEPGTPNLCSFARGQYQLLTSTLNELENTYREHAKGVRSWLPERITGSRAEAVLDLAGPYYAQWCEADMLAAIEVDKPSPQQREKPSLWQLRCLSNVTGCQVFGFMAYDFGTFHVAQLEQRARRHALAVALWLHHARSSMPEASLDLPAGLMHPRHQLITVDEEPYLEVPPHNGPCEPRPWRLPLPG
ncbi:hypothetical protein IC757_13230 [Wenzhouxiangella sp. AB-CW3]|uniref:hypothetical protein n=1 Tax=Wenzhouxiangella sp. AB-CW3 TaxID=2771012 RepID=UPI00168ABF1D|nr:hypothetical protein [Wenzhouxiangella sp. AB-CW3]QOC21980.1 hypothetical protein IC757_13230 [Wenzhouxiangella sp. AB-CW3]